MSGQVSSNGSLETGCSGQGILLSFSVIPVKCWDGTSGYTLMVQEP
jgi:hypothetical protein